MSLDLAKVAAQVSAMVDYFKTQESTREKCLATALDVLRNRTADLESLRRKAAAARTSWLVGIPVEPVNSHFAPPAVPGACNVIATDGSNIDVDRHHPTRCYLINIGSVVLKYGPEADAFLDSTPHLCSDRTDMVITGTGSRRERAIEGVLLGIKRSVDECHQLATLAAMQSPQSNNLALIDGSLILWSMEQYPELTEMLLQHGFLADLERMRQLNADRQLAVAGYISFPGGTDVNNLLKVTICPEGSPDCEKCPPDKPHPCDDVAGIRDRELFAKILHEGERSGLFLTRSQVQKHYGDHRVHFFYLNVCDEIARVEIPEWVATNKALLDLTHALVLDQCRRGLGYPVALSEAHEQAVVTGSDREVFWNMVDDSLLGEHMDISVSAKSLSKKMRWV